MTHSIGVLRFVDNYFTTEYEIKNIGSICKKSEKLYQTLIQ